MATATPILDQRPKAKSKSGTFPIIIRVRHKAKVREIPTKFKIEEKYWTGESVSRKHPQAAVINSVISDIISQANNHFAACAISGRPIMIELIGKENTSHSFPEYLEHRAKQFRAKDMIIMGRKADRFAIELRECFGREIYFDEVSHNLLRDYEAYLIQIGNIDNTRNKKFKFLQEFYGQAVADGKAVEPNLIKTYKIPKKPVRKEKLTLEELQAVENLELRPGAVNDARNLFLFSYYCKGARFENCVTVKRSDMVNGRISFRSNKGQKFISVKIHPRLQNIIDQYEGDFLFPFVKEIPAGKVDYISMIGSLNVIVNRNLKTVAGLAEIKKKVTFHIARHTFAYHLMGGSSIHVIKQALGHSDYRTTEIYLRELDEAVIDQDMDRLYG